MLDNERLIYKMLLEQKIRLVTSAKLYRSSSVGAYEFPVVRFREKPARSKSDAPFTQFPSDRTLACSWNPDLIESVFSAKGEEFRSRDVFDGYFSCNDPKRQGISSSHYLTAEYLGARNRGAAEKQPTAHRIAEASFFEENLRKNLTDTLLDEGAPDVLIAESVETAQLYLKNQRFTGLVYGIAYSPEEVAQYFFAGCSFVYLGEDFTQNLIAYFDERIKNYRVAYGEYRENRLSLKELDRRARALDIFDESLIDNACDRVINFLKKKKKGEVKISAQKSKEEEIRIKNLEEENARLARRSARESVVLLKNSNRILPLGRDKKVAVIGEYLENFDYQSETFEGKPTREKLPVDVIKEFEELNIVGYAAGYRRGDGTDEELVANAARLASDADCAIVFLSAEPGAEELPENQTLLVRALIGWNVKVIAVISADRCVNTDFAKKCYAVLYTGRGGQESVPAVLDLITGADAPSGRLAESVDGVGGYPFGYGLTYGTFEYRDFKIDESGVSVIVENKGDLDGYAVVQLYLRKDGSFYSDKTLKGFAKEFIKKGDSVRVKIPFTENTFRYYDAGKKKYRTQGGEYEVFLSESAINDKLKGTVKIAADDGRQFTNTVAEASADADKTSFTETRGLKEKKGMPFGWKLFLAISLLVYYNAVMGLLLLAPFIPVERTTLFYAIVGALTLVVDALIVAYIVVIALKRKKSYIPVNDVLSDMVDKVDEFVQIAKLTYPDPIKLKEAEKKKAEEKKAEEETKEEEKVAVATEEAEKEIKEDKKKTVSVPSIDKPGDYPEAESFEGMCASFREYVMKRGINLGVSSSRKVLAAIASSRMVLISSKNNELLPEFMQAVNAYFGGLGIAVAEDNWNTTEDLMWSEVSGKHVYSLFTNAVVDTARRHNKNAVALIGNVSSANLPDWFKEMIDFASSPSEEHCLVLNKETQIAVPKNFCCLLFAQENGFRFELTREIIDASLQIEVSIRRAEEVTAAEVEEEKKAEAVSYPNFCALERFARENFYLSEKNWVKIDTLFAQLNASEEVVFGNKNMLQSEKYTSVLMSCGADESKALECLFLAKIIPILKTTKAYAQEEGATALYDLIRKIFPDEDLTKVQKALSERPVKVEVKSRNTFYTPDYKGTEEGDDSAQNASEEVAPEETFDSDAPTQSDQTVPPAEQPAYTGAENGAEEEVVYGSGGTIASEQPVYETSATEQPVYETPATEQPVYETPATEQPVYETPATEQPVYETPATEQPVYETPATEQPDYEASAAAGGYASDYGQNYGDGTQGADVYGNAYQNPDGNYGGAADQYNYGDNYGGTADQYNYGDNYGGTADQYSYGDNYGGYGDNAQNTDGYGQYGQDGYGDQSGNYAGYAPDYGTSGEGDGGEKQ